MQVLKLADKFIRGTDIPSKLDGSAFTQWNKDTGFSNFFTILGVEPSGLWQKIADTTRREELEERITSLCKPLLVLLQETLSNQGLREEAPSSCKILEGVVGRILRLTMINWSPTQDSLCWTSCVFMALQSAYPVRVPVGAGLLMLLTESDRRSLLGRQRVNIGASSLPLLTGGIQPFLSFLQDIEMADYAVSAGSWASGQKMSHELKNVCWSITSDWVMPASDWFRVESCSESDLPKGKLGTIRTPWPEHVEQMGIASYRQLILTTGYQIRLWSGLNLCGELPFAGSAAPKTLAAFATAAFDFALDVMLIHALYSRYPHPGRPSDLAEVAAVSKEFKKIFLKVFKPLDDQTALNLAVRWDYGSNSEDVRDPTLDLGKLFISIFCNVIQHADPRRPITVRFNLQGPRLLVDIVDVPRAEEVSESDFGETVESTNTFPNLPRLIANALNQSKQSIKAMSLTPYRSESVIRDALEGLNGSMSVLPEGKYGYTVYLEIDSLSWSSHA